MEFKEDENSKWFQEELVAFENKLIIFQFLMKVASSERNGKGRKSMGSKLEEVD